MRVVVTRPAHSAARTAERLRQMGHEVALLPLTQAATFPEEAEAALKQLHSDLALTSAEAVRVLHSLGNRLYPYLLNRVYAVGEATALAAAEAGFRDIRTGQGTGAQLANLIANDLPDQRLPLLYLAGRPRSPEFEASLQCQSISFRTTEIYAMTPVHHEPASIERSLLRPRADILLLYSRRNAELFFRLAPTLIPRLGGLRILCLSANVAEAVPPELHRQVEISPNPREDALLDLV